MKEELGRPFVGKSGLAPTKFLEAIGFKREDVFICNVLKHRPTGNRNPSTDEIHACPPSRAGAARGTLSQGHPMRRHLRGANPASRRRAKRHIEKGTPSGMPSSRAQWCLAGVG